MIDWSIDQNISYSLVEQFDAFLCPGALATYNRTHRVVPSSSGKLLWAMDVSDIK